MEETERTAPYRKDPEVEAFFQDFNRCIAELEARFEKLADPGTCKAIFIVGAPRSGTTLLSQILASAGFGYVSNFIARFWSAPATGAFIQKSLGPQRRYEISDFASVYGVTNGWFEPHEFGYYWNRWFDFGQDTHTLDKQLRARVDTSGLSRSVAAICTQFDRPVVFKNTTWCSTQSELLARCLPKSMFIYARREPIFAAHSILMARRARYGADGVWWSNRPSTFHYLKTLTPHEQVLRQVVDLQSETETSLSRVSTRRVIRVDYEELCKIPERVLRRIVVATDSAEFADLKHIPKSFKSGNDRDSNDEDWRRLDEALAKLNSS